MLVIRTVLCLCVASIGLVENTVAATSESAVSKGQPSVVFSVSFDDVLQAANGVEPVVADNAKLASGKEGQGVAIEPSSRLAYPLPGGYMPEQGTVSFWVQPRWDAREAQGEYVFWSLPSDEEADNRVLIGFRGSADGQGHVYFGNDYGFEAAKHDVDWREGEWHHVQACWDESTGLRALVVDGQLQSVASYSCPMPHYVNMQALGYLIGSYQGIGDGHKARAVLDNVTLSRDIDSKEFWAQVKARRDYLTRNEPPLTRLPKQYSLNRVAEKKIEVGYEDLLGMAKPVTVRMPIQPMYSRDSVQVLPDMSIALGMSADSLGLGVAIGNPVCTPELEDVSWQLHKRYLPIPIGKWQDGPIQLRQISLTFLPEDEQIRSGGEPQYLAIRVELKNLEKEAHPANLQVLLGRMEGVHALESNYKRLRLPHNRWEQPPMSLQVENNGLMLDGEPLLVWHCDSEIQVELKQQAEVDRDDGECHPTNCVSFTGQLGPLETRTVDLFVLPAGQKAAPDELIRMERARFDLALLCAESYWHQLLEPGMKLVTPDQRVNDIYQAMILGALREIRGVYDHPWDRVVYGSFAWHNWAYEYAEEVVPLFRIGYARMLEPTLHYFIKRQVGVGRHSGYAQASAQPGDFHGVLEAGNYVDSQGMFQWTCATGTILWPMGAYYRYTHDDPWLEKHEHGFLAAWDWIQKQRGVTRQLDEEGERQRGYGLMPAGRACDLFTNGQYFGFTDNFSWHGMAELARAFREARLDNAEQLMAETEEYRECILDAFEQTKFEDPETGIYYLPMKFGVDQVDVGYHWLTAGPLAIFGTKMLKPTHPWFEQSMKLLEHHHTPIMGLVGKMDSRPGNPIYTNWTEDGLYMNYLGRGEFEKALLVFYTNLAYALTQDLYVSYERFDPGQPLWNAFQPMPSGYSRIVDMMRRAVIDEQDAEEGILWLLRGCPKRWFAPGESIVVKEAPTLFGKMAFDVKASQDQVQISLQPPSWPDGYDADLNEIRIVVRPPGGRHVASASVNGETVRVENNVVFLTSLTGPKEIICALETD